MVSGKVNPYRFSERREQKRQKRRWRSLKGYWQAGLCSTILWGIWQLTNAPLWYLYSLDQVTIEGEHLLTEASLKSHIKLPFPQYVFQVEPKTIGQQLQNQAPLEAVEVNRKLFPAQLVVKVKERVPVARAMNAGKNGYLDRHGIWTPASSYPQKLNPPLSVLGFSDHVSRHWAELYPLLASSPVKIHQVNWLDANNLILHSELGIVHCGNYHQDTLISQLEQLDRMRELPKYLNSTNVRYLDFRDISSTTAKFRSSIP